MELHQLRCAVAVAEHDGFTRAASALHLTQPAVSYAVAKLEAELDVELFRRVGRGIVVTAAGEAFLAVARDTLRAADRVKPTIEEITGLVSGRLEIASPHTLVRRVAVLTGAFRRRHPSVVLRLADVEGDASVLEDLRSSRCELGLLRYARLPDSVQGVPIAPQEFVAIFAPGTSIGAGDRITLEQLATNPLVAPPRGTANRAAFERAFAARGLRLDIAVESAHPESIVELVLAGAGASLASLDSAAAIRARGALVRRLSPPLVQPVHLAWRDGRLSPAAAAFRALAVETPSVTASDENEAEDDAGSAAVGVRKGA